MDREKVRRELQEFIDSASDEKLSEFLSNMKTRKHPGQHIERETDGRAKNPKD